MKEPAHLSINIHSYRKDCPNGSKIIHKQTTQSVFLCSPDHTSLILTLTHTHTHTHTHTRCPPLEPHTDQTSPASFLTQGCGQGSLPLSLSLSLILSLSLSLSLSLYSVISL